MPVFAFSQQCSILSDLMAGSFYHSQSENMMWLCGGFAFSADKQFVEQTKVGRMITADGFLVATTRRFIAESNQRQLSVNYSKKVNKLVFN